MRILKLASLVLLLIGVNTVWATDYTWDGGASNDLWTDPVNWAADSGFPIAGDNVFIGATTSGQPLIDSTITATIANLFGPGYFGATVGVMNMTGGSLTATTQAFVGYNGNGTFNLSGGTVTTPMLQLGNGLVTGSGTLTMSGGTLNVTASAGLYVGNGGTATFNFSGGTVSTIELKVGNAIAGTNGTVNVTAGNFTPTTINIGSQTDAWGHFNVSGGTVLTGSGGGGITVGSSGHGTMNVTGGSIDTNGKWLIIGYAAGSTGEVHLDAGTITCHNFAMGRGVSTDTAQGLGTMDITGGTLVIDGDYSAAMTNYKNWGRLTGYGSIGYKDNVHIDYNITHPGQTTVTATPVPWTCAKIAGDVNGDCVVNFADLAAIAADWTKCNRAPSSYCQ